MNPLTDAAIRERALDPSRSFIVQAPAGSGKTELLTRRFLRLLATVRRPDEILAITFTRKAAAEMRHRLLAALEGARGPAPQRQHERQTWELAGRALAQDECCGWRLLENPTLLSIQTIDSFNAALVRRMPWLSRFGAMPEIAADPSRLYREAARRTLARVGDPGGGGAAVARLLAHLDNRMERLQEMLVAMLGRRDQWLRHLLGVDPSDHRHRLEAALAGYVEQTLRRADAALPGTLRQPLLEAARFAAGNVEADRPLALLADLQQFPGAALTDLDAWLGLADLLLTTAGEPRRRLDRNCGFPASKGGQEAAMKEAMQALLAEPAMTCLAPLLAEIRRLPPARYADAQWQVLEALVELLPLAARELWLVFRETGEVDFAEVAGQALRALREEESPSELLLRLDARLSHILLDEFQDTSWLQYGLLERLTEGWTAGDGRTLFVVGDPMQSIYRFREAEVGLFLLAQQQGIGAVALEPLLLGANFRSRAGVVEWVNGAFSAVFPAQEDLARGAVRYAPAHPVHPPEAGEAVEVHPLFGRDDVAEAQQVVALVREARRRGDAGVAILVRSRTHLVHILPALRQAGEQYLAQEIDPLAERPVARDLVSLARALLHPGDRLAWLAVLRAPWCGLSLRDLHALCGGQREAAIPALLADAAVLSRLTPAGRTAAGCAFAVLQRGQRQRGRIGLRRLVEGCWLALGGPACVDGAALEDAERVFGLLGELERGGDLAPLESLEEGLRRLFAAPDAGADGWLQVMTIHKAKGLEFDTVIVPGLGRKPAGGEQPLLRWLEHPQCGLLLAPIAARDGNGDPIYEAIGRLEREREALEATRLLYVAATRARRRLHLLGHADLRNGDFRPAAGSLLEKLWPAVAHRFAAPPGSADSAVREESGLPLPLRRLPAGWVAPALSAAPVASVAAALAPSHLGARRPETLFEPGEGMAARGAGTVAHALLERIARQGVWQWDAARVALLEPEICARLVREGVSPEELASCCAKVLQALQTAVGSRRGRWILGAGREAGSELGLSGVIDGRLTHAVIDRTFIDDDGVRWVIDYKTSEPPAGEAVEDFYRREEEHYRGQLETYAVLLRYQEPGRPVRAALYFPLFDGWREVPLAPG